MIFLGLFFDSPHFHHSFLLLLLLLLRLQLSSELMPMVKIVPRGFTACVDAYLTPCIHQYLRTFQAGFDAQLFQRVQVNFMQVDAN